MAVKYVIDTSAYSAFFRGDARLRDYFASDVDLYVPLIVVGELRAGFAAGAKREYNEKYLQRFLDSPQVNVLNLSDKTATIYATIYAHLKKKGTPIGSNDMWIAALALEHGCQLVTLDADFRYVPDLSFASV